METYSRTQAMEGASGSDPVSEWTVRTGETGLEEPFWHLGLGGEQESYPERPDEADCMYYLRTGYCGYGNRCRFNHPLDRTMVMGTMKASGGDYPERPDQPVCQYYMKTGMCKFGASCKYHHPSQGGGSQMPTAVNIFGYPLRLGEKECSYYVKTGQCKFGVTCKFHHPQPAGVPLTAPVPGPGPGPGPMSAPVGGIYPTMQPPPVQSNQQCAVVSGNWPVTRPTLLPGSYVPGTYGHMMLPPGMVSLPGWTSYPPHVSSVASATTQPNVGVSPVYGLTQLSPSAPAYTGQYLQVSSFPVPSGSSLKESALPERPGEPECQFYMKTGDCKFGTSCRYHHPSEWSVKTNYVLSPLGLPLRPDATICSHYAQNGICKVGTSCKYDHPMTTLSYCPSASSLTGMPVAPYPVGSYTGTLALSSSSSDLRPELLVSGSSQMSSGSSSSSDPIGSLFSKGGSVPHSNTMKSGSGSGSGFGAQDEQ